MKKTVKVITGGIGSGKSFVCEMLKRYGIMVYDCDAHAKQLMQTSAEIKAALTELIGKDTYCNGVLNKAAVAKFLLENEQNTELINNIVHPAVGKDFLQSQYTWLESAIFFEAHFSRQLPVDTYTICVSAPLETRIARIMQRDDISREKALEWIAKQMSQEEKERQSDFIIINDGKNDIIPQLENLLHHLQYVPDTHCPE